MIDLPPRWAVERAYDLYRAEPLSMELVFARYIAEHEEAPVDPLLIEAKCILHENLSHGSAFHERHTEAMEIALIALRRGIEIGSAK